MHSGSIQGNGPCKEEKTLTLLSGLVQMWPQGQRSVTIITHLSMATSVCFPFFKWKVGSAILHIFFTLGHTAARPLRGSLGDLRFSAVGLRLHSARTLCKS